MGEACSCCPWPNADAFSRLPERTWGSLAFWVGMAERGCAKTWTGSCMRSNECYPVASAGEPPVWACMASGGASTRACVQKVEPSSQATGGEPCFPPSIWSLLLLREVLSLLARKTLPSHPALPSITLCVCLPSWESISPSLWLQTLVGDAVE